MSIFKYILAKSGQNVRFANSTISYDYKLDHIIILVLPSISASHAFFIHGLVMQFQITSLVKIEYYRIFMDQNKIHVYVFYQLMKKFALQLSYYNTYKKMKKILALLLTVLLITTDFSVLADEKFQFQAEVGRLMDIIINSLYTQKQIFLRQLISNASDALDKIRFLAISNPDVLGTETQLEVKVQVNQDQKVLEIVDNGIGMTKNELIKNLGTIASSGTANFLDALEKGDINLIGQFGVGFYSSFLAASKVEVISKHNDDKQHKWISSASNTFQIEEDDSVELKRGTIVRLHLKQDAQEFLNAEELQKLIKRYSSFINYPIYLQKKVQREEKTQKSEEQLQKQKQELIEKYKSEGKEINEQEIENQISRTVTTTKWDHKFERMNENQPLWTRDKNEVKKQQYQEFYKSLFKQTSNPLTWNHFKAEGDVDFTALLFVPERANFDQFDKFYERKSEVKLFVRRVLINDEFEDLLPRYLNFLKAIVDSDSLPLNVNRENLQQKKALSSIGSKLLKKAVDMLVQFNPKKQQQEQEQLFSEEETQNQQQSAKAKRQREVQTFNKFWKNYHKNIKLGLIQDDANRKKLAVLTRWYTTKNISELTSLDEYISRMKEGQKNIYYLGGQDKATLQHSPLIQRLVSEGYEVVLGDDPLDETIFNVFREYNTYKIVNVAKNDFKQPYKTDDTRKQAKFLKQKFQPLIDYAKKQLSENIKDVKISLRLVNNPVTIVADMANPTPNRERIDQAAALRQNYNYGRNKNILEINPHHPMIQQLNKIVEDQPDENSQKLIKNLYYAGLIHSGYLVKDPQFFSESVFSLINKAFQIDNEVEDIVVTQQDIDEMENSEKPEPTPQEQTESPSAEQVIDLDSEGSTQQVPVTISSEEAAEEKPEIEEL